MLDANNIKTLITIWARCNQPSRNVVSSPTASSSPKGPRPQNEPFLQIYATSRQKQIYPILAASLPPVQVQVPSTKPRAEPDRNLVVRHPDGRLGSERAACWSPNAGPSAIMNVPQNIAGPQRRLIGTKCLGTNGASFPSSSRLLLPIPLYPIGRAAGDNVSATPTGTLLGGDPGSDQVTG